MNVDPRLAGLLVGLLVAGLFLWDAALTEGPTTLQQGLEITMLAGFAGAAFGGLTFFHLRRGADSNGGDSA